MVEHRDLLSKSFYIWKSGYEIATSCVHWCYRIIWKKCWRKLNLVNSDLWTFFKVSFWSQCHLFLGNCIVCHTGWKHWPNLLLNTINRNSPLLLLWNTLFSQTEMFSLRIDGSVSLFLHQLWPRQNKWRKDLLWLTVTMVSEHLGKALMREQSNSYHSNYKDRTCCFNSLSSLLFYWSLLVHGAVSTMFATRFLAWIIPLYKDPHGYTQKCAY